MAHIRDGVKKYQKEKEERERTEAAIAGLQRMQQQRRLPAAPMTPVSSVSHAMQATTLAQQSSQNTVSNALPSVATSNNPFANSSGGQGNLFRPPLPPVMEADRDMLNHSLSVYPIQPNTAAGIATWHNHLRDWKVKNGENAQIMVSTGFPLRPGGAPPGSGECYGCGQVGRRRSDM